MSDGTSSSGEGLVGRLRIAAVYVGAALGPFSGGVVSPMLPRIGQSLGVPVSTAALSLSVYFVPFALVQLVSWTLGERWGRRRTVFIAYLVYLVAALVCAIAPDAWLLLSMRGVLGVANAFTAPLLLLAGLADMVPVARLSRSVGIFTSCQAGGWAVVRPTDRRPRGRDELVVGVPRRRRRRGGAARDGTAAGKRTPGSGCASTAPVDQPSDGAVVRQPVATPEWPTPVPITQQEEHRDTVHRHANGDKQDRGSPHIRHAPQRVVLRIRRRSVCNVTSGSAK